MFLSAAYVRFRDVQPIWDVALQAWFYLSPIMYAASTSAQVTLGSAGASFAMMNPIATLLAQPAAFAGAITGGRPPLRPRWRAGPLMFAILLIFATFGVGWWFFTREAPRVAENL